MQRFIIDETIYCRKCGANQVPKEGDMCSECIIDKFALDDLEQIDPESGKEDSDG